MGWSSGKYDRFSFFFFLFFMTEKNVFFDTSEGQTKKANGNIIFKTSNLFSCEKSCLHKSFPWLVIQNVKLITIFLSKGRRLA